jgi:putative ABC transport system ATP-binding protein
MEPLIKTEKLCVIFNEGKSNEYMALKDVSIEIYPKEYIIFFGPSGTGKSTLLYSILGLLTPASGKILLKGREYKDFSEKEKNERTARAFGMVFQQYNLLFSLNVLENVILPQVFLGQPSRERREKAVKLLRRFGIEARAKQSPAMLSGGQQQRVAVCRALINDPDIILADEPVGNLDSESARIVMETLKNINVKDQKTVILVTHDARYLPYADRVYYFKDAGIDHEEKTDKSRTEESAGNEDVPTKEAKSQDLERMARVHPDMSLPELKACSLSNWLVEEATVDQRRRLEAAMSKLIAGKISQHQFFEELDKPYAKGGVGLYYQTAMALAKKVAHTLREAAVFAEKSAEAAKDKSKKHRLIRLLRSFMLEEHKADLSPEKMQRLSKFIDDRLEGRLDHESFVASMTAKFSSGGVGFASTSAQRAAERLEIITALKD